MQDHLLRSYSSQFIEYKIQRAMKGTFGVVQRAFQLTSPDYVDAQISYNNNNNNNNNNKMPRYRRDNRAMRPIYE